MGPIRAGVVSMWALIAATLLAIVCASGSQPLAQGIEAEELSAEVLRQDIRFLQMLLTMEMTAEQRLKAAQAIETFHQKREAISRLAEPPELLTALSAVREALLRGSAPTDALRQAVEAAQPRDRDSLDHSFREARDEVLAALEGLLSEEQKEQLRTLPLAGLADEIVEMCLHAQQLSPEEAADLRLHAFPEIREQLARATAPDEQRVLNDFQALVNRVSALTPEQVQQQRPEVIGQIVAFLKASLDRNREMSAERLRGQLWEWVIQPRTSKLLRESAEAMGTP